MKDLCACVAARLSKTMPVPMIVLIWTRLNRIKNRILTLMARIQAGTLPVARKAGTRPARPCLTCPPNPRLPRRPPPPTQPPHPQSARSPPSLRTTRNRSSRKPFFVPKSGLFSWASAAVHTHA